jgi:P27 family predicted phage terminase small subunit
MGRRGPKPKPTRLRIIDGDRPDRINESEPVAPRARRAPPTPPHLSDPEKAIWRRYAGLLHRAQVLTEFDLAVLELFCCEFAAWREATKLARAGLLIPGAEGSLIRNPARSMAAQAAQNVRALAGELALTPSARSQVTTRAPFEAIDEDLRRLIR